MPRRMLFVILSILMSANLSMTQSNTPPELIDVPTAISVGEGQQYALKVRAKDVDGDSIFFTFCLLDRSPLPAWLTVVNDSILLINGGINDSDTTVLVIADDRHGGRDSAHFIVQIGHNTSPFFTNTPDSISVREKDSVVWQAKITDYNNDRIKIFFSLLDGSPLPQWLNVTDSNYLIIKPTLLDNNLIVRVIADDSRGGKDTFNLRILIEYNVAPVINSERDTITVQANSTLGFPGFPIHIYDKNGDLPNISLDYPFSTTAPAWISLRGCLMCSEGLYLSFAPKSTDSNTVVRIIADDGWGGRDSLILKIAVSHSGSIKEIYHEKCGRGLTFRVRRNGFVYNLKMSDINEIGILDLNGKVVRCFTTVSSDIVWDGLDSRGHQVGNGMYILRLRGDYRIYNLMFALW
jgi:hypothetical protein